MMDELEALALAAAARKKRDGGAAPERNPDGTYGQPPDGMVTDPRTGQMTERALMANDMQRRGVSNAESAVIGGAQGATFGGADEAFGGLYSILPGEGSTGDRYAFGREYARAQQDASRAENPVVHGGSEIAGAMSVPLGVFDRVRRGAGAVQRMGQSIAGGAGLGGLYSFLDGEGGADERLDQAETGAKWGAVGGAAAVPIGAGVKKVADALVQRGPRRAAMKSAQTAAQQRAASGAQYDIFENAGVELTPDALSRLRQDVTGRLNKAGATHIPGPMGRLDPNSRKIAATLKAMDDQVSAAASSNPRVPLKAVDDVRKKAGQYAREVGPDFRPTNDSRLAGEAVSQIDDFMNTLQASDIAAGDAQTAHNAIMKARELWRRSIKTQKVENAIDAADRYLGGTESGLRNQVKSLLRRNAKEKLFTPDEEKVLKKIIGNNMLSRAVRAVGDGLGRKMAMGGGFLSGGIEGAAIGAAGAEVASHIGESAAKKNAEIARALISSGGLQNLPKAPESVRLLTEMLTRRAAVAGPQ